MLAISGIQDLDQYYQMNGYKRCCRGIECCHPESVDGWLAVNCFHKGKNYKNGLRSECKFCKREHDKKRYKNNSEYIRKQGAEYRKTIIGRFRKLASAANLNCDTQTTYKHLICLFVAQTPICPYTETKIDFSTMHLEHILAKTNGGDNNYDNLVFVSEVYNLAKNGFLLDDFIVKMGKLINKDQMLSAQEAIKKIHNRYEFMIDDYLKMTDDELTLTVSNMLSN